MSEVTPLHVNTASGRQQSNFPTQRLNTLPNTVLMSKNQSPTSTIDSNVSYGSATDFQSNVSASEEASSSSGYNDIMESPGNRSSATTPNMSNLSSIAYNRKIDILDDNGGEEKHPRRIPKHRLSNTYEGSRSENNMHTLPSIPDIPSPISPPRPPYETPSLPNGRIDRSPRDFFPYSRVKTSFTICLLVLGLILCICTLLQYFILGSPSSLPFGGDGNVNANDEEFRGGINGALNGMKPGSLFDELGRYVIDNYDAVPTFSDFLPVS